MSYITTLFFEYLTECETLINEVQQTDLSDPINMQHLILLLFAKNHILQQQLNEKFINECIEVKYFE